jgi:hypothetical protein
MGWHPTMWRPGDAEGAAAQRGGAGATTLWRSRVPQRWTGLLDALGIRGARGVIGKKSWVGRVRRVCLCNLPPHLLLAIKSRSGGGDQSLHSFHRSAGLHMM